MTFARIGTRRRAELPPVVSGYELNPERGYFSVVIAEASTNLLTNPSAETNTTGYAAIGAGTLARTTTRSRRGAYSVQYTPAAATTDGLRQVTPTLTSGLPYTFSVDFWGRGGFPYLVEITTTLGVALGQVAFVATGAWQRLTVTATATSTAAFFVRVRKNNHANTKVFFTDGWQLEQKSYPTTYFDGDSRGLVPNFTDFYWSGTQHASSSVRAANSAAGGREVKLKDLGFRLMGVLGLGLSGLLNQFTPIANGGAFFQGTVFSDRSFTLLGALAAPDVYELQMYRQALTDAFKPDRVSPQQPLLLRYTPVDDCGVQSGETLEIPCVFESDLSGNFDNLNQERVPLTFRLYLPIAIREEGDNGTTLDYQDTIADANNVLRRKADGVWAKLSTGVTGGYINVMLPLPDGRIAVGGDFTAAGGVASTKAIAIYDPVTDTFSSAGGGANTNGDTVHALALAPDNNTLIAAGIYSGMGSVAATDSIAAYSISANTWSSISSGLSGGAEYVAALGYRPNGELIAAGEFTSINGVGVTNIAKRSTAGVWVGLGNPGGIIAAPSAKLYLPDSTNIETMIETVGLRKYDGTSWTTLHANDGSPPLVVSADGKRYFWNDGPTADMFVYNGVTTATIVILSEEVRGAEFDPATNLLYFRADTESNSQLGFDSPFGVLLYTGSFFLPWEIDDDIATWSLNSPAWAFGVDGAIYFASPTTASVKAAAVTTVTNSGTANTYPRVTFYGPGAIYTLRNISTNRSVYFDLTLNAGEIATLDFSDPLNVTFSSNFRPNLLGALLPGSNFDFFLQPGANSISLFIAGTTDGNTAAVISWRNAHHGIDGARAARLLP